jgi:hypothetical protein
MKRAVLGFLFVVLTSPSWGLTLWGVDINGLEVQASYYSILNSVKDGAPDPFVNAVGASIPFRFLGRWTFRPEAQVFVGNYAYGNGRAYPVETMFDNVSVLGLMLNPTVGYEFPFGPVLSASAEVGMGFLPRFPIFLNGAKAGDMALPVTGWLMAGRFLYPDVGAGVTWQFSPLFAFTVRGQVFYPVFNLWNGLPWYDEFTYGGGIGVRFTF